MIQQTKMRGFTLVELLLAMSFLAILLVAIATLTIQVTNIYTRGVTLTAVDQAGQTIAKELQDALNQSAGDSVNYVATSADESGDQDDGQPAALVSGGRLCTGSVTYAWNYGPAIQSSDNTYGGLNMVNGSKDVRFVKYTDPSGSGCVLNPTTNSYPDIPSAANPVELLSHNDRNVALRDFQLSSNGLDSQVIYSISMTIATTDSDDFLPDETCKPPTQNDDSFCAVNTFNFTARSGSMDATGGQG